LGSISNFEIVSDFEIRISNLGDRYPGLVVPPSRHRGQWRVQTQDYLIAIVQNLQLLMATLGQNRERHLLSLWPVVCAS
jgi:hypothetical protein